MVWFRQSLGLLILLSQMFLRISSTPPGGTTERRPSRLTTAQRLATRSTTDDLKALSKNISTILDTIRANYDRRVRPNYGGDPVTVGVTMYVLSISSVSEVQMDFTVDFYFRQRWKDPRLVFQGSPRIETLSVGTEFLKSIWVPDTFFVNEKSSYFHEATTPNEFLRITQDGDILRSIRLTVTASCPMDLRHFPMDSQLCFIEIESFGYQMSDIRYVWSAGAASVGMEPTVSLPQFKVMGYLQRAEEISLSTGNYSRLACDIQFVRSMGYYLIQIYIPSSLIVVISWVSFWLNRNAAPARVYLGITTVLTMTTLMSSTNKALPKISYVKSIDVFLGTCFVMVFAALLEYATVGYLAKRIQMRKNHFSKLQRMAIQLTNSREEHFAAAAAAAAAASSAHHSQLHQHHPHAHAHSHSHPPPGLQHHYAQTLQSNQPGMSTMSLHHPHQQQQDTYRCKSRASSQYGTTTHRGGGASGGGPHSSQDRERIYEDHLPEIKIRQLIPINPNQICGITPSDIDKYSRVVFPVCFVCFNLLYWIIYLHISNVKVPNLVLLQDPNGES